MDARSVIFAGILSLPSLVYAAAMRPPKCTDTTALAAVRARAEANCDCGGTSRQKYVRCVRRIGQQAVNSGELSKVCKQDLTDGAEHSTCGKSATFVTCCTNRPGRGPRCRISESERACEESGGTSGGPGSCLDTCFGGGPTTTQPPVTTTSTTTSTTATTGASTTGTSTTGTTGSSTTATSTTGTTGSSTTATSTTGTTGSSTTATSTTGSTGSSTTGTSTTGTTGSSTTAASTTSTSAGSTTSVTGTSTSSTSTTTGASTSTIPTTTTQASTTTTTIPGPECCPAGEIVTSSTAGILLVSTLAPFPFPPGVLTTIDVGAAEPGTCEHSAVVPPGGFTVPVFCIPALGFTSQVEATNCESGGAAGNGTVWDASATCADADVSRVGDTSDPDGNSCGSLGSGCNTGGTGAGNDTAGNIDTTRGNGTCDTAPGVHTQLDIPVLSTTWNDADANCPDDDLTFDAGTDTLITQFNFILSPTTGTSNADYTDLNADACAFAGNGPDHVKHCAADAAHPNPLQTPCATNIQCGHCSITTSQGCVQGFPSGCPGAETCVAGSCVDGALQGIPAPGPCCTQGQTTTVVATGIAFTGGAPLFDLIFANAVPATISACNAPPATPPTCVLTTNPCMD
jgi:hypothetical protein